MIALDSGNIHCMSTRLNRDSIYQYVFTGVG